MAQLKLLGTTLISFVYESAFLALGVCSLILIYVNSGCDELDSFRNFKSYKANIITITVNYAKRDEYLDKFLYYISAKYSYTVNGKIQTSNKVSLGKAQWLNYEDAQEQLEKIMENPIAYVSDSNNQSILINPLELNRINTVSIWIFSGLYFGLMMLASKYSRTRK